MHHCSKCGAQFTESFAFCANCGNNLTDGVISNPSEQFNPNGINPMNNPYQTNPNMNFPNPNFPNGNETMGNGQYPQNMNYPYIPPQPKKSNTGLIIGIVAGALILVFGLIFAFVLFLNSAFNSYDNFRNDYDYYDEYHDEYYYNNYEENVLYKDAIILEVNQLASDENVYIDNIENDAIYVSDDMSDTMLLIENRSLEQTKQYFIKEIEEEYGSENNYQLTEEPNMIDGKNEFIVMKVSSTTETDELPTYCILYPINEKYTYTARVKSYSLITEEYLRLYTDITVTIDDSFSKSTF